MQEFYKYKFDTSHSSLTGTYFDISPSNNFNLITEEKEASTILPGNSGAFTNVKFGFGSRLADNNYQTKRGTDFTNFYYCLLYTSPSPRDYAASRMPSSA